MRTQKKKRGRGRPRKDTVPLGVRVTRKAEQHLREFMDRTDMKLGEAVELAIMQLKLPRRKAR